jgi:hypothetical protein
MLHVSRKPISLTIHDFRSISGASVAPNSQVRAPAILLLLTVGNQRTRASVASHGTL